MGDTLLVDGIGYDHELPMRGKIPNEGGESLLVLLRGVGSYNDVAALGQPFERGDGCRAFFCLGDLIEPRVAYAGDACDPMVGKQVKRVDIGGEDPGVALMQFALPSAVVPFEGRGEVAKLGGYEVGGDAAVVERCEEASHIALRGYNCGDWCEDAKGARRIFCGVKG